MKKTNAMRILDGEGISYKVYEYEAADGHIDGISVSEKIGMPKEIVYKTLITEGASKENYCFILPCHKELDLKKAAKAAKEKAMAMIKVSDINKITGYIRGGCSPVGLKKPLKTFIDSSVSEINEIIVSPGKIGLQMALSPEALIKVTGAVKEDLAV